MKTLTLHLLLTSIITIVLCQHTCLAQNGTMSYSQFIRTADSLYNISQYKASAQTYSRAFLAYPQEVTVNDRYNAACSRALCGDKDSAFMELTQASLSYSDYCHLCIDPDFRSIKADSRWTDLAARVHANKEQAEQHGNKALIAILDSIYISDQQDRALLEPLERETGQGSTQMQLLWQRSINLIKTKAILDRHGWLGADSVGLRGNTTLFLVIQHADLKTQEHYLPLMRDAVKRNNARASSLALLEDRVALGQGKRQIYGSQVGRDATTNSYYVLPLEDPMHVDERRKKVGLQPLADYLRHWNTRWQPETYEHDLKEIEQHTKKQ